MKYLYLSIFLITLSCGSKKNVKDDTKNTTEVKETKDDSKEVKSAKEFEELLVVLKNPKNLSNAKALVTNSGLKWDKLLFDQEALKIGLIKVPAAKKDFWIERLGQSGEFRSVEPNKTGSFNRIVEEENNNYFTMRKSPCFGDCPVYEVTIDKDGNVVFNGKDYTLFKGKEEFKLTDKEFNTLKSKIESSNFNKLKDKYDNPRITDLPSTFVRHNGKEVQIRIWKDVPANLSDVHEYVEGILLEKKLIK